MAALVVAAPVVAWGLQQYLGGLFVMTGLVVAVPLMLWREPKGFGRACATVGLLLLGWGVLAVLAGMFLFWPSAMLLLFAVFADPLRRRPVVVKVMAGGGVVVTAMWLVGCVIFAWQSYVGPALAEPHTYRAETSPGWFMPLGDARTSPDSFRSNLGDAQERLEPLGATFVTGSSSDEGSYLEVRFREGLSGTERTALREEIARLPGIVDVQLCSVSDCG
ncbi:hypothetical protein [Streptomyces virginiae]|uniref:hypothetical protein n=1 Tax=Streptomyces virginiae TaxID=1961 RepID=UPI003441E083